jgi:hypothetical protein
VDVGDIVRDERHGVGVVLVAGPFCQVRFLRGKGRIDSDRLTVLLHADLGAQFMSEAPSTTKIEDAMVEGATLWLRSDNKTLRANALGFISASTDPRRLVVADRSLAHFPPAVRSRITSELSEARTRRGLDPWPETMLRIKVELESRRLRREAEREAHRAAEEIAKGEADLEEAVRRQIVIVAEIRLRLGRPVPSAAERLRIAGAVRAKAADPADYSNHCWSCQTPLHSTFNSNCPVCHWLVCICGACRKPNYVDPRGRQAGPCPRETAVLPSKIR